MSTAFWCSKCKFSHPGECAGFLAKVAPAKDPGITTVTAGNGISFNPPGYSITLKQYPMHSIRGGAFNIEEPDIVKYLNPNADLRSISNHKSTLWQGLGPNGNRVVTPCVYASKVFTAKDEAEKEVYIKRWCNFLNAFADSGLWQATLIGCGIINIEDHQRQTIQCVMVSNGNSFMHTKFAIFSYMHLTHQAGAILGLNAPNVPNDDELSKFMKWDNLFVLEGQLGNEDWNCSY